MHRHQLAARILGAALLALVWLPLSGCLFEPRTPETPSSGQDIPYLDQSSPRNVWENLQAALNYGDSFGWQNNIHEDFVYVPDSEAAAQYPVLASGWGKEQEMNFIRSFFNAGTTNVAEMRNSDFNVPPTGGTESRWEGVIYYVRVINTEGGESRYRASAIINFVLDGNDWYVNRWEDQVGESDPDSPGQILSSMGVLRGTFGSN